MPSRATTASLTSAACLVATCFLDTGTAFMLVPKTANTNNAGLRSHGHASSANKPPLDGIGFGEGHKLPRNSGYAARLPRVPSAMDHEETSRARWSPLRLHDVFGKEEAGQHYEEMSPPSDKDEAKRYHSSSAGEDVSTEDVAEVTPPPAKAKAKRYYDNGEEVTPEDLALVERAELHLFGAVVGGEDWEWGTGEGKGIKVTWADDVEWDMDKVEEKKGLVSWIKRLVCGKETAAEEDGEEKGDLTKDWLGRPPLPPLSDADREANAAAPTYRWTSPEAAEREKRRFLTLTHFDDPNHAYTLQDTRAERLVFHTGGWGGWYYPLK